MRAELRSCRRCVVLQTVDTPIASAGVAMPTLVTSLVQRHGARLRYLLAINGAYIAGARTGLVGAGRRPGDPPFGIAAGDGDASEFERIRSGDYQRASIAEPLFLQGWQLIDELNRARAGEPASGYVASPRLITKRRRAGRRRVRSSGGLSRQLRAHLGRLTADTHWCMPIAGVHVSACASRCRSTAGRGHELEAPDVLREMALELGPPRRLAAAAVLRSPEARGACCRRPSRRNPAASRRASRGAGTRAREPRTRTTGPAGP